MATDLDSAVFTSVDIYCLLGRSVVYDNVLVSVLVLHNPFPALLTLYARWANSFAFCRGIGKVSKDSYKSLGVAQLAGQGHHRT